MGKRLGIGGKRPVGPAVLGSFGGRFARSQQDVLEHAGVGMAQFGEHQFEFATLTFQQFNLFNAFRAADGQRLGAAALARREHGPDLAQREVKPFALLNHGEAVTVQTAEDPRFAVALRRQQALALVKSQNAQGYAGRAGEFSNSNAIRVSNLGLQFHIAWDLSWRRANQLYA